MDAKDRCEIVSAIKDLATAIDVVAAACLEETRVYDLYEAREFISAVRTSAGKLAERLERT